MARDQFETFNEAFLEYDFSGQLAQAPRQYGDDGNYESLVKAAYVARGELSPDLVDDQGLDLDEAMHMGQARVAHWVGRLQNGELEPDRLLTQMLEEAQAGNEGLNEDPTHIEFREEFAKSLQEEIETEGLGAGELMDGDRLQELIDDKRQEVGVEIAERHEARYALGEVPEEPREWYMVDVDEEAVKADLVENGAISLELQGAVGVQIPNEVLERIPSDIQEDLEESRISDPDVGVSFEFTEGPELAPETIDEGDSFEVTGTVENTGEQTDTQTVKLSVADKQVESWDEELGKGETFSVDESLDAGELDLEAGAHKVEIEIGDDSVKSTLRVGDREPPDLDLTLDELSIGEHESEASASVTVDHNGWASDVQLIVKQDGEVITAEEDLADHPRDEEQLDLSVDLGEGNFDPGAAEVRIEGRDGDEGVLDSVTRDHVGLYDFEGAPLLNLGEDDVQWTWANPQKEPFNLIGQVFVDKGGPVEPGMGTGTLISPQHVITNAHVVAEDPEDNNPFIEDPWENTEGIQFRQGRNGAEGSAIDTYHAKSAQLIDDEWFSRDAWPEADMAIVTLDEPVTDWDEFDQFDWFWNAWEDDDKWETGEDRDLINEEVMLSGYGAEGVDQGAGVGEWDQLYQWSTSKSKVDEYWPGDNRGRDPEEELGNESGGFLNDGPPGNGTFGHSGSPAFMEEEGEYKLVGLYSGSIMGDPRAAFSTLHPVAHDWALTHLDEAGENLPSEFFDNSVDLDDFGPFWRAGDARSANFKGEFVAQLPEMTEEGQVDGDIIVQGAQGSDEDVFVA
ncbi:trypsin-like peptidase domain-containing protein [Halorhodospira halochloris]|uniref:trypsin-like serine peptidase n=1 Tax=Halorhodospira halochloris TaxID=1052 RepID=UPI001EE87E72|nr:trypsin-like peptidase domain-containing protein [Halorhodospira halochloris]MCG5531270.1 trypsin-like peptidase domain-containing protein [Halorhodospira halochloris]